MANSGEKHSKKLTQHVLMRNLLGIPETSATKSSSTQTDENFCFCGRFLPPPAPSAESTSSSRVKKQVRKFNNRISRPFQEYQQSKDIVNLMQTIKQHLQVEEQRSSVLCSDSDDWSECQSLCTECCEVNFPKETQQAMKMLQAAPPAPPLSGLAPTRVLSGDYPAWKMRNKKN